MARFRGTVKGGRGEASRLGHSTTGLWTKAAGWKGNVEVRLYVHMPGEEDWVSVFLNTDEYGNICLYHGPLNKYVNPRQIERIPLWDNHNPTE